MASIVSSVQTFRATIRSLSTSIRLRLRPPPSSSSSSSSQPQSSGSIDLESQLESGPPVQDQENQDQLLVEWKNVVMETCMLSALQIFLSSAKTESQLPISFQLLSLSVLVTFLFLFVSNFIGQKFAKAAQVLEKMAVLLVATTVVFAIAIPFPLSLKCVTWALYAISLVVGLICRYRCF